MFDGSRQASSTAHHLDGWLQGHVQIGGSYSLIATRTAVSDDQSPDEEVALTGYAVALAKALASVGAPPARLEVELIRRKSEPGAEGGPRLVELRVGGDLPGDVAQVKELAAQVLGERTASGAWRVNGPVVVEVVGGVAPAAILTTPAASLAPPAAGLAPPAASLASPAAGLAPPAAGLAPPAAEVPPKREPPPPPAAEVLPRPEPPPPPAPEVPERLEPSAPPVPEVPQRREPPAPAAEVPAEAPPPAAALVPASPSRGRAAVLAAVILVLAAGLIAAAIRTTPESVPIAGNQATQTLVLDASTAIPPTAVPDTAIPPTPVPAAASVNEVPATAVAPTAVLATAVPPVTAPAPAVLPTPIPATVVPPTLVPANAVPPAAIPATAVPPTAAPPTAAPPTAVPTVAPTAQPTLTIPPQPRTLLDISPTDVASGRPAWPDDPNSTAWFGPDGFHLMARQASQFVAVGVLGEQRLRDGLVTAVFHKTSGPAGGGYGIILRDQGPAPRDGRNQIGRYYVFEVGDRGEVGIWRRDQDQWVDILPWTAASAVHAGNADNTISVKSLGQQLSLSVNGVEVATRTDASLDAAGGVGIFLGGDQNHAILTHLTVQSDD